MLDPICQVEDAYRDTLIAKATGRGFDDLAVYYQFPRLASVSRKYWRRAMLALIYGCRGTLGTTFTVLEAIFDFYAEPRMTHIVTLDPAHPTALIHEDAFAVGGAPGWTCDHTSRLCRFATGPHKGKLFWAEHLADGKLYLSGVQTAIWNAADWSDLDSPLTGVQIKLLPFNYREAQPGPPWLDGNNPQGDPWHPWEQRLNMGGGDQGFGEDFQCTFEMFIDEFIWPIPATYLQEDGTVVRPTVAPGQPWGGHIMDLISAANDPANFPESGDPFGFGPHPIYFTSGAARAAFFERLMDSILAAGAWTTANVTVWCEGGFDAFGQIFNPGADHDRALERGRLEHLGGFRGPVSDRAISSISRNAEAGGGAIHDFVNDGLPRHWRPDEWLQNFPTGGNLTQADVTVDNGYIHVIPYQDHIYFFVNCVDYGNWNGFVFFPNPPRSSWPFAIVDRGQDLRDLGQNMCDARFSTDPNDPNVLNFNDGATSYSWAYGLSGELQANGAALNGYTGTPVPGDGSKLNSWMTAPESDPIYPSMAHMIFNTGGRIWHPHFENFTEQSVLLNTTAQAGNAHDAYFPWMISDGAVADRPTVIGVQQAPDANIALSNQTLVFRASWAGIPEWSQINYHLNRHHFAIFRIADNQNYTMGGAVPNTMGGGALNVRYLGPFPADQNQPDATGAFKAGSAPLIHNNMAGRALQHSESMRAIKLLFDTAGII